MTPSFRQRLQSGERLLGTMITLASAETAEVLAGVGFDWFFLDNEHSPMEAVELQGVIRAMGSTPCVVRVSHSAEVPIKKALDIGAAGIIAPQINSAEQAAQGVGWAKYAPVGTRGVGIGRAHGYGLKFYRYVNHDSPAIGDLRSGRFLPQPVRRPGPSPADAAAGVSRRALSAGLCR